MIKQLLALTTILFLFSFRINAQCVSDPVTSLVSNGDFSKGNTSFISGYSHCNSSNCLYPEGYYAVGKNANYYHGNFVGRDHTTGTGNFMIVNGAGVPNTIVWSQTITVKANTDYNFSAWVMSVTSGSPAQLQFEINGVTIGSIFNAPSTVNTWQNFFVTWNSGSATTAVITILNQNTTLNGNDFGLDDISFTEICNTPVPNLGSDQPLCGVGTIVLDANITHNTTTSVTWSDGTTGTGLSAPYQKNITAAGTYWVCVKDGPCVKTDTINITANFSIDLGPDFTLCAISSFDLDAVYSNSTTTYKWYKDNVIVPDSTNRTFLVRSPGTYKVEVYDASCGITRSDEVVVNSVSAIPVDGQYCPPGLATFAVTPNPTGGFKWYDKATGGTYKGNGNTLSVSGASGTMTMYAEDTSAFTYNVGPTSKFSDGWASAASTDYTEFDALTSFTLDAVTVWAKVYNPNDSYTIGVKIYDNTGAVVSTMLVPVTGPPIVPANHDWPFTVTLGINIPAGTGYKITNEGTVGDLFWAAGAGNTVDWASYQVSDVITLKGMGAGYNYCYGNCYGFFYNWQISKGNDCARVPVVASVNCVAPVEFINFTATCEGKSNLLVWQTAWEKNSDYFSIERSLDGKNFESLGIVKARGNNNSSSDYQFQDYDIQHHLTYYRIREVDVDGNSKSTQIEKVVNKARDKEISIYPNPTGGNCSVVMKSPEGSSLITITVHSSIGEMVLHKTISDFTGEELIDMNSFASGVYLVTIVGDVWVYTDKVVKK